MPKVNGEILKWARKTAQLSLEDAARKIAIKDSKGLTAGEKLSLYEESKKDPSRSLLIRMSKQYHRPIITFYLKDTPRKADRGEDFRTLPANIDPSKDANVDALLREIKTRQSIIKEALLEQDEGDEIDFIGMIGQKADIFKSAELIKNTIAFDPLVFRDQKNHTTAFSYLREKVEESGVYVILKGNLGSHHTEIDVQLFRGFALADKVAPFIVINDRDASSAWSFTLLHELAHIFMGQTGVSAGNKFDNNIEKKCNDIASEILVPSKEFNSFRLKSNRFNEIANEISDYANKRKVSSTHISYRLYKRGDIDQPEWIKLRDFYREKWLYERNKRKERSRSKEGGPNYYVVKRHKLGSLVNVARRFADSGALTTTEAGMLLDVRPIKVHKIFETTKIA
ncbi:MAG: peptidase [Haliea sp.]|nr:peptidase [Haliea sp.]|tara:strand:- start:2546 stop:3736 length:1191 start_codon:yes stop_codon:yes gene_type:complete